MKKSGKLHASLISMLLTVSVIFSGAAHLTGCGVGEAKEDEIIELLDPVSVAVSSVPVQRRNLYSYKIVSAVCAPKVYESAFSAGIRFKAYEKLPGEDVSKGDIVISANTSDLDKQIRSMEESLKEMRENNDENVEQLKEKLAVDEADYEYKTGIVERLEKNKPDESDTEAYEKWAGDMAYWDAQNRYAYITFERSKLNLKKTQELFKLDYDYQLAKLAELRNTRNSQMLISDVDGKVLALGYNRYDNYVYFYRSNDWINKNTIGMAIGDTSVKEIRCNYINTSIINKAQEVYAVVNGEKYDLEFVPMTAEEYKIISDKNGNAYSTFYINDPDDKVRFGDFVVIVIKNDSREGVLCVPKASVANDTLGQFVYALEGESYKERRIRTGMSDGEYVEILSGLEEGEMVKTEYKLRSGSNEAIITRGKISSTFSATGYLFYPSVESVTNPVEHGTTYLDEICVSRNQMVEAGEVIARIHVISDSVEIDRTRREIQRLNERLAELSKDEQSIEDNKYQIRSVNKQLSEKQEYLSDMNRDAAVTEIVAAKNGMITEVTNREPGTLLSSGDSVATLAADDSCFISVDDADGKLSYGNEVTVTYKDDAGNNKTAIGTVETANAMTISRALNSGVAIVRLPVEAIAELAGSSRNNDGWWSVTRVDVKADLRSMDNVLIIPKKAVSEVNGTNYVTVMEDNGSLRVESFIAGGSDSSNYWVAEGLEEGTKICWE